MLLTTLRVVLAYLTFFQPVIYGGHLCRQSNPDPKLVTNTTLSLMFAWFMELADMLFLSSFIATKGLYLFVRIVLCLYFSHPTLLGATHTYDKLLAGFVDAYAPLLDRLLVQHMDVVAQARPMTLISSAGIVVMRSLVEVVHIARILIEAMSVTNVSAAPLPRRYSQVRELEDDEEKYATPSVINRLKRAGSEDDDIASAPVAGIKSAVTATGRSAPPLRSPNAEESNDDEPLLYAPTPPPPVRRFAAPPPPPDSAAASYDDDEEGEEEFSNGSSVDFFEEEGTPQTTAQRLRWVSHLDI